MQVLDSVYNI